MTNAPDRIWAIFEAHHNPEDERPYVYATTSKTLGTEYVRADIAVPSWQPISTAPRDGAVVLVYQAPYVEMAVYQKDCWRIVNVFYDDIAKIRPTHWMPLPLPPEESH